MAQHCIYTINQLPFSMTYVLVDPFVIPDANLTLNDGYSYHRDASNHDDVIKWKHFPRYWSFVRRIPSQKASTAELWCFLCSPPE